jgi:endonuclease/exonuclease/phosphatase (EEP) superfamily protein YafD
MKRIALYAEMPTTDGRTISIVNVHNEPFARPKDRLLQHRTFLDTVESRGPEVAICCGDFNPSLSQRREPGLRLLEASGFENAFAHRWRALDTCFARGHREILSAGRLAFRGSDHRPIVVRLKL